MEKNQLKRIAQILSGLDVSDATDIEMRIFKILEQEGVAFIENVSYDSDTDGCSSYQVFAVKE